jgi:hypothetical protein
VCSVVDSKVSLGYKNVGEVATHQNPTKLDAEDQEETVDMARKVFKRLYTAAFKGLHHLTENWICAKDSDYLHHVDQ